MYLNLLFGPRDPEAVRRHADAVSDPTGRSYGAFLERISQGDHAALEGFLERCRIRRCAGTTWSLDRSALVAALGREGAELLLARRADRRGVAWEALHRLDPTLRSVELSVEAPTPRAIELPARAPAPTISPQGGFTPEQIRRGYSIDAGLTGDGETIAVMALGGAPDRRDLEHFWAAHDLAAPSLSAVSLGPVGADDPLCRLETTMNVQWIGALAPGARIVVYLIDPTLVADPWSAFLVAALADRVTIAVTSWSAPERQYHRVHGREVFAGLLDQAAALGTTVIAASGDWGAYDGMPRARGDGPRVCDDPGSHATFPGCESRVLSVGGTQVTSSWRERAWSAPIPEVLRHATGLEMLAGSGGFSAVVPVPQHQRAMLRDAYPTSSGALVAVTGRAQPDVSLAAWGDGETGYLCLLDGVFRDYGGGTSVAAPIWAALIAQLNEARRRRGRPRLGACGPLFYRIPYAFRPVIEGTTDIVLPVVEGNVQLPGFIATEGWNPAVGLGVPRFDEMLRAVLEEHARRDEDESTHVSA